MDAQILAYFTDLDDLNGLNDANVSTRSHCIFGCIMGYLTNASSNAALKGQPWHDPDALAAT